MVPLLVLISIGMLAFNQVTELPIGADLPKGELKLKDISGKKISLLDARKKNGLLVMFSCNTCPYVIKNEERTKKICQFALANEIGVVLVNSNEAQRSNVESLKAMKTYAAKNNFTWYYAVDSNAEIANAFGAMRTPENFLFNKQNKLVYHGAIDDNPSNSKGVKRNHLMEAIRELIKGNEVTVKTSRSVGCSIKRL